MTAVYVIAAILFFGILIIIHEFGHFIVAKWCGVRVEEFSIGFGPAIFSRQKGETAYSIRCLPLGGYCAMTGESGESEDPRAFVNQPLWKRLLVLVAGSFNNFVFGVILVFCLYIGVTAFAAPVIGEFVDGCPYNSEDGLQVGDRFLKINGKNVYMYYDVSDFLAEAGDTVDIVVERDGKRVKLDDYEFVPIEYPGSEGKRYGFSLCYEEATFGTKLRYTWNTSMQFGRLVWQSLGMLFSGEASVNDLSGPVGIVDAMADTASEAESTADAVYDLLYMGAFIAINLAIMNMLPIPGVDGGQIFLAVVTAIIETITRKKLDPKYAGYINAAGLILLLALMMFIMFNDILKVFFGG